MKASSARLAGTGLTAAAVGCVGAVLLLRRADVALDLGAGGSLLPQTAAVGVLAAVAAAGAAWAAARAARRRSGEPGRSSRREWVAAGVGAVLGGAALLLAAAAERPGAWTVGVVAAAVGFAPVLALHRPLLAEEAEAAAAGGDGSRSGNGNGGSGMGSKGGRSGWAERDRSGHAVQYAAFSGYWAAVLLGALGAVLPLSFGLVSPAATLTGAAAAAVAGGLLSLWGVRRELPAPASDGISVPDVPWARRSLAAAFGLGALIVGASESARGLLFEEWQRSPQGAFGVLSTITAGGAATLLFGRWYHRLADRKGAERAGGIGLALFVGGAASLLGAFSFTYVGLITSWVIACGSLAMAAAGLDAATWTALRRDTRRVISARQITAFSAGAGISSVLLGLPLDGRHDQLKIALASLGCICAGLGVARRSPASQRRDPHQTWNRRPPKRVQSAAEGAPLLQLENINVSYEEMQVLFDVNLSVAEGQIVALLGTNGAGKTTTLRCISGLEPARSGRLLFRGLDITRTPPAWRVGMGLQQIVGGQAVAGDLSVAENLRLFCHGLPRKEAPGRIEEALAHFERLGERLEQSAETLSGGEKQMLALAKALIVSPRLLIIDEFSLGLAPAVVAQLLPVLGEIAARGTAILIVEQSVRTACSLAEHVYVMEKGSIRREAAASELLAHPEILTSTYLSGARAAAAPAAAADPADPADPAADPADPADPAAAQAPQ